MINDEYQLFLRLIQQRKDVLINKYQNKDILDLLNQWSIDKKREIIILSLKNY